MVLSIYKALILDSPYSKSLYKSLSDSQKYITKQCSFELWFEDVNIFYVFNSAKETITYDSGILAETVTISPYQMCFKYLEATVLSDETFNPWRLGKCILFII